MVRSLHGHAIAPLARASQLLMRPGLGQRLFVKESAHASYATASSTDSTPSVGTPRLLPRSIGPVRVLRLGRTWLRSCDCTLVHSTKLLIDWLASGLAGCFSNVRRAYIVRTHVVRSCGIQIDFKRYSIILGADAIAGPRAARVRLKISRWIVFKRHSINANETAGRRAAHLNLVHYVHLVRTVLLGTELIPNTHNSCSE